MRCGKVGLFLVAMLMCNQPALAAEGEFAKGSWGLELTGAYITPIRFSDDKFYNVNLAGSYYLVDNLAIGAEIQGYYVDQPDEDAIAGGVGVLGRWHFFARDAFSLFIDGGGGVIYADPEVPEFGTHFNFTGKGGLGATIRLRDDLNLIGGARYFHLSNGNIHGRDQNPSFDGVQFWMGLMWKL
jgi:hypothetical protein